MRGTLQLSKALTKLSQFLYTQQGNLALFPFPPHKLYATLYVTNFYYSGTCNNNVTCVSNGLSWFICVTFLILAREIVMTLILLLWYGAEKEKVPKFVRSYKFARVLSIC